MRYVELFYFCIPYTLKILNTSSFFGLKQPSLIYWVLLLDLFIYLQNFAVNIKRENKLEEIRPN